MSLSPFETFDHHVLRRLAKGPDWSQRFPKMKPVLDRLVDRGCIVRRPAPGSKVSLMVVITERGRTRLALLNARLADTPKPPAQE